MSQPVYAAIADLTSLSIPSGALTGISAADQLAALAAASRVADGYLGPRFHLPLTQWGEDLRQVICDIAAYRLMKRRGFSPESGDAEQLRDSYEDAVRWLEQVSKGMVTPNNVIDSDASGRNSTVAEPAPAPMVVQLHEAGTVEGDSFWGSTTTSGGGVGRPKRRGW